MHGMCVKKNEKQGNKLFIESCRDSLLKSNYIHLLFSWILINRNIIHGQCKIVTTQQILLL